ATAPNGHSIRFDDGIIGGSGASSISITFTGAEVGVSYSYTITSSGGGMPVTGAGMVSTAGERISGIDVNGLNDGTLTLSATLTDGAGNSATAVTDMVTLDKTSPAVAGVTD